MRKYYNKPNFTEIDPSFELTDFDGVDAAYVYAGSIPSLEFMNKRIKWRDCDEKTNKMLGIEAHVITLGEIVDQIRKINIEEIGMDFVMVTVFIDSPMDGIILQYGNHGNKRYKIGDYAGYA
jgi:hypothetical protein